MAASTAATGLDPVAVVGIALGAVALGLSLFTVWRTELRGAHVECLIVPGSAEIAIDAHHTAGKDVTAVNLYRDLMLINDGPRPGYVPRLDCSPRTPAGATGVRAGVVPPDSRGIPDEFHRLDAVIDKGAPRRVTVGLWFVSELTTEAIRDLIRLGSPDIGMDVEVSTLEASWFRKRFKRRRLTIAAKTSSDEKVIWADSARSL